MKKDTNVWKPTLQFSNQTEDKNEKEKIGNLNSNIKPNLTNI